MFWEQRIMTKAVIPAAFMLAFVPSSASAKDTRFWNLTANTITSLQLSPPGKNEWGRNQADNDRDHTVDHDERLKITDTAPGIKGATATNQLKDAELETGLKTRVPSFIEVGEVIRINTETGDYLGRA